MATLERIFNGDQFLGLIIRKDYHESGIQFLTDDQSPQQLGYMNRAKDYVIAPHVHNVVPRTVEQLGNVLFAERRKGKGKREVRPLFEGKAGVLAL